MTDQTSDPDEPAATRSAIDLDEVAYEAEAVVTRLMGDAVLDALVAVMLDYDAYPTFLWRRQPEAVSTPAAEFAERLRPRLSELDAELRAALDDPRLALALDPDSARRLVQLATSPRFRAIPSTLLYPPLDSSRVLRQIPWLGELIDDRGLLAIKQRIEARPDVVFAGDWAIPYHQFLRRDFAAGVNDVLIGTLIAMHAAGNVVSVAIDERRLHPRAGHLPYLERDYWSGPPITEERLDDPTRRGAEVTQHGWPAGKERLPWSIEESVSVRTHLSDATRTIEIEEITMPSLQRESPVQLVRYLHAERNIERHVFTHSDGAVRFYDRRAYEGRRGVRWPSSAADEPVNRRKVFRVDGAIPTPAWAELVAQWFRGSELVLEALTELGASSDS